VSPAIATLTTSGGSVSGTWSAILSGGVLEPTCGPPQAIAQISGTVSGTVLAGGSVTLNLVCTSGCDGKSEDTVLTGTATSLTSSLLGGDVIGSSATGSVPISFTGTTSGNQTTYTGGGNGGGTVDCGAGVTGNWTGSLTGSVSLTPAIPSLAANGG